MQKLGFLASVLLLTAALVGPIGFSFAQVDAGSNVTLSDIKVEKMTQKTEEAKQKIQSRVDAKVLALKEKSLNRQQTLDDILEKRAQKLQESKAAKEGKMVERRAQAEKQMVEKKTKSEQKMTNVKAMFEERMIKLRAQFEDKMAKKIELYEKKMAENREMLDKKMAAMKKPALEKAPESPASNSTSSDQ